MTVLKLAAATPQTLTLGAGGMSKGRLALLDLGVRAPDLVDTGTVDWDDAAYGPADGRQKPPVSFAEQVVSCCSTRLQQLVVSYLRKTAVAPQSLSSTDWKGNTTGTRAPLP